MSLNWQNDENKLRSIYGIICNHAYFIMRQFFSRTQATVPI